MRDHVEEQSGLLYEGDQLGQAKHDHGQHQVHKVIAGQAHQQQVKVFLELFPTE